MAQPNKNLNLPLPGTNVGRHITDGEHWLLAGMTRYGKSQLALRWLVAKALAQNTAIVLFDPPGGLADLFVKHLAFHGQLKRVVWDRLANNQWCPGYDFLTPHTGPNAEELDLVSCTNFKSVILQHEGKYDARENQGISEGLDLYTGIQITVPHIPPFWFEEAFNTETAEHKVISAALEEAIKTAPSTRERTRREKLLRKFKVWSLMKGPQWLMYPGALVRRLRVLSRPWVRNRHGASFGLTAHLNNNQIWIVSSDHTGGIDYESSRFLFNMLLLKVFEHHRSGAQTNTFCVCDEIVKAGYLSSHFTAALSELAKRGLSLVPGVQNPARMSDDPLIQSDTWGNTHKAFCRLSGEGARMAAREISTANLNPHLIKYTEETWQNVIRQVPEKYKTVTKHGGENKHESVTEGERLINIHDREMVKRDVRYDFSEQDRLPEQELVNGKPGWFHFIGPQGVTQKLVYVPMLPRPFGNHPTYEQAFFDKACQFIFSGPAYRRPVIEEAQWTEPPSLPPIPAIPKPPPKGNGGAGKANGSSTPKRKPSGMKRR
jgi:hypothetical protein